MNLESITSTRLVPVAVIPALKDALPLAEALLQAGLPHIEITLRTDCALAAMRAIRREFPEMIIGAGTILDPAILPELVGMGIAFGVSPGLNPAVSDMCIISRAEGISHTTLINEILALALARYGLSG